MRLCHIGLLALCGPALAGEILPEKVAETGRAALFRYGAQRVLVAHGSPREMGRAHGRLLRDDVRRNVHAFLHDWAIGRRGRTRAELQAIWDRIAKHVPAHYHQELEGLAEGSGVPLDDLRLVHAIPSRYHCTGTAATGAVTRDGKVYHTRSLDYALDIGDTHRPQSSAILLVAAPDDGVPHAVVTWAGFVGCVTGMNVAGVSVGEMGSSSSDETYDGFPMVFLMRETLRLAESVQDAKDIWRKAPRTCGYNFVFCDADEVCAVECNRSRIRFFGPGDEGDDTAPHYGIDGIVRRCNHFVDRALAATQRDAYDPRASSGSSWSAYRMQGEFLKERRGEIDAATMIELLRQYPPSHPCLHQAVMCPTDGTLWVSHARDPAKDPLAGAQNQAFYRYDLKSLLGDEPARARVSDLPEVADDAERGFVDKERAIEGFFAHEPRRFAYTLKPLRNLGKVTIHHLTFPSPGPSEFPGNLTVHAEYYRPAGDGPFPAAVVLHILDGRFYVARLVASALAQRGVAALFLKLPYYGERRPQGDVDLERLDLPDVVGAIRQGVRDVRRGAAWLRARPEVDGVGIVGVSLGSFAAQLAAGADGGFDRCCFVLGGGSIADTVFAGSKDTRKIEALLAERGWTEKKARDALAPVEPLAHVKGVRRDGVLMINCRQDEVVPPASTRRYWEAIGKPEIVWYDGGHYALKNHVFEVLGKITAHFAQKS